MIDPDLKYCPECDDEYRAEIEKCAACSIDLITGLQKIEREKARLKKLEGRRTELSPDDELVAIRSECFTGIHLQNGLQRCDP